MRRKAIRFVAAAWILASSGVAAQTVKIERTENGGVLEILWPGTAVPIWERQGVELVLRFGRVVEAIDLGDIQRRLAMWIEGATAGYDTVLLRGHQGVIFDVAAVPNGIRIGMTGGASTDPAARRRLEQLRARLEAESGKEAEAEARLSALAAAAPRDADVMVQRAGIAEKLGRWSRALGLYDQALKERPNDADIMEARRRLARERQAQIRFDPEYQRVHGADRQWMLRGSAFYYPEDGRVAGTSVEARHISDGNLRRLDGTSAPADIWREKAELFYGVDVGAGGTIIGRLLASSSTPGFGAEWQERRSGFEWRLGTAYREAYWDTKEAIPAYGTVDRLYGRMQWLAAEGVTMIGGLAAHRYGVEDDVDVARTARWDVGLRRDFKLATDEASTGYTIDAETIGHRDVRLSPTGTGYRTLPLRSRETHSVDLTLRREFSIDTWVSGQIGWSYDRLTDAKGPLANVKVSHEPADNIETGFKFGFAHTTGRGSDGLARSAGAYVVVRF